MIKSYAKINLSLNVLGRINSNLHKIETLVSFIDLNDEINIKKINKKNHRIYFYGKFAKGIPSKNTVSKLINLMDKDNLLKGKKYLIKIKKNIPQKAGLGGGSMNAASLIRYFLSKNNLIIKRNKLIKLSKKIGFDVNFGLKLNNTILLKNQSILRTKKKIGLYCVLVKPRFGCSTKLIYKKVKTFSKPVLKKNFFQNINLKNIKRLNNDLEEIAKKAYPQLEKLINFMKNLRHLEFVRMTGSGSTVIAYFKTRNASENATKVIKKKYKKYWCILSKTI
jgi:4-diphosphocytidyl-2-C-methyl-D-erythritol kinase|tara:strand:+ start:876 stop:1712 length:837 start_codon:yes stop_codon:yes gene_type:complete